MQELQDAVNAVILAGGNKTKAADALGIARTTLLSRLDQAARMGISADTLPPEIEARFLEQRASYEEEIKHLKALITANTKENLTTNSVRRSLFKLSQHLASPPRWQTNPRDLPDHSPGIPTVFLSDWHWGEVVRPEAVNGINQYNVAIARERWRLCVERSIRLINHQSIDGYPYVVVALGGDMVSGDIHDELAETNELSNFEAMLDVFDHCVWAIDAFVGAFGKVVVPCVYGNHGRLTVKPQHKNAAVTNCDWLLYTMLERHYKTNPNVTIMSGIGYDCRYTVYNTTYLLTHGDRIGAKGGTGNAGIIAPISRGIQKLKANYSSMKMPVDVVIMGHFHNLLNPEGGKVNDCGKGYDEFAMTMRFDPHPPSQRLWFTHPKYGITTETTVFLS